MADYAIYFDSSKCTGCKGCQVACKCWNLLPSPLGLNANEPTHSYQAPLDLNGDTRIIMNFEENDGSGKWDVEWSIGRRSCMHCFNPGCAAVCPTGALSVDEATGFVRVEEDRCIGCRYCATACPFDVPRYYGPASKINKCTACLDRVSNGKAASINSGTGKTATQFNVPACVHTCPPGALEFGLRDELLAKAHARVEALKSHRLNPSPHASVYGEDELEGTHVIMVLKFPAETYGLPKNPQVNPVVAILGLMKPLTAAAAGATVLGLGLSFITGIGYHRDTLRHDEKKHETVDVDTGAVVWRAAAGAAGAAAGDTSDVAAGDPAAAGDAGDPAAVAAESASDVAAAAGEPDPAAGDEQEGGK
jgi:formate dehydrogenase iron-sulfur subunit